MLAESLYMSVAWELEAVSCLCAMSIPNSGQRLVIRYCSFPNISFLRLILDQQIPNLAKHPIFLSFQLVCRPLSTSVVSKKHPKYLFNTKILDPSPDV